MHVLAIFIVKNTLLINIIYINNIKNYKYYIINNKKYYYKYIFYKIQIFINYDKYVCYYYIKYVYIKYKIKILHVIFFEAYFPFVYT